MSATQQRSTVVQTLLDEPYRFQFCQAVRLALEWLAQHGITPERALTEHLVFENILSFSFAPAQVAAINVEAAHQPLADQHLAQPLGPDNAPEIHITPAFMGFLGVSGTLPFTYTERLQAHISTTRDEAPRAFLDMFSSRALAQFYMAWCKHRVEHTVSSREDAFLALLLNFAGLQPGGEMPGSGSLDDETLAQYVGVLLQRPVPPDVLARVLSDYLRVPLAIRESAGNWITLLEHEQCALGGQNTLLGSRTLIGERSWRPDLHAQIRIGPLSKNEFDALLPNGASARVLAQLLGMVANPTISFEVQLILKADEVNPVCLFGDGTYSARLGQDSFLVAGTESRHRDDVSYRISLLAPLSPLSQSSAGGEAPESGFRAHKVKASATGNHPPVQRMADNTSFIAAAAAQ